MIQGVSGKLSAYNSLPRELTKHTNINKTYRNARLVANVSRVAMFVTGVAGIMTLFGRDIVASAFNFGLHFINAIYSKESRNDASKEMRAAYKEIINRAKIIYKK